MAGSSENGYSIRLCRKEFSTGGSFRQELAELQKRIEAKGISAHRVEGSDRIEVPSKAAAEQIVSDPRVNREGDEIYLHLGSEESNYPPHFPANYL